MSKLVYLTSCAKTNTVPRQMLLRDKTHGTVSQREHMLQSQSGADNIVGYAISSTYGTYEGVGCQDTKSMYILLRKGTTTAATAVLADKLIANTTWKCPLASARGEGTLKQAMENHIHGLMSQQAALRAFLLSSLPVHHHRSCRA